MPWQGSLRATAQHLLGELFAGMPQLPANVQRTRCWLVVTEAAIDAPGPSSLAAPPSSAPEEAVDRQYSPDQPLHYATQQQAIEQQPGSMNAVPAHAARMKPFVPADTETGAPLPPAKQQQVLPASDEGATCTVPGADLHAAPLWQAAAAAVHPNVSKLTAAGHLPAQPIGHTAVAAFEAVLAGSVPGSAADTVSAAGTGARKDSAHQSQRAPGEPIIGSAQPCADTQQPAADPAEAPAAAEPASGAARGASPSPTAAGQRWTPLIDYIIQKVMQRAPDASSREAVLEALHVSELVYYPNLYKDLNDLLRHMKVRTKLASSAHNEQRARDQKHGISYLGLSCPADIMHSDPLDPGGPDISCAAYLARWSPGPCVLQYPFLPCVDILNSRLRDEGQEGGRAYKSFPLEHCLVNVSDMRKPAGDQDWPWHELPHLVSGMVKIRMPHWVADKFSQHRAEPATTDCAAHSDDVTLLAGGGAGQEGDSITVQQAAVRVQHAVQAPGAVLQQMPQGQLRLPPQPTSQQPQQQQAQEVDMTLLEPYFTATTSPTLNRWAASPAAAAHAGCSSPPVSAAHCQGAPTAQGTPTAHKAGHALEAAADGALLAAAAVTPASEVSAIAVKPMPVGSQMVWSRTSSAGVSADTTSSSIDEGDTVVSFSSPSHLASATGSSRDAFIAVNNGFNEWLEQLYPTKQERRHMKAALNAVGDVVRSRAKQEMWSVSAVHPVGSVSRKTCLRNSHDLDLLVELNVDNQKEGHFEQCRDDCLHTIQAVLCATTAAPAPAAAAGSQVGAEEASAEAVAASGWQLQPCLPHWLRLHHPVLDLQLDVHVCQSLQAFGSSLKERMNRLLQELISRASSQRGDGSTEDLVGQLLPLSGTAKHLVSPSIPNKSRTTLLTPLMRDIVAGFPRHCAEKFRYQPDSLATETIRAVKAWSKFGLARVLQQQAANSSSRTKGSAAAAAGSSAAAAAETHVHQPAGSPGSTQGPYAYGEIPPGYMWEIIVLYVFEQKLQQAKAARGSAAELYPTTARNLQLFMDVLETASRLLRPGSSDVIALYASERYTAEQCEMFRQLWGPVGPLNTPYIISPVDPSYNCTKHYIFKEWGAVADAAGELYQQMQAVLHADMAAAAGQPGGSSGGVAASSNAWEQLLRSSSLGPAVQAFATATACT